MAGFCMAGAGRPYKRDTGRAIPSGPRLGGQGRRREMTKIAASTILTAHRAWMAADFTRMQRRPAGTPRGAYRAANPIPAADFPSKLADTAYASRPIREASFIDASSRLFIRTHGGRVVEIIELTSPDADQRLARYEVL